MSLYPFFVEKGMDFVKVDCMIHHNDHFSGGGAATVAHFESVKKVLLIEDNPADARWVELLLSETDLVQCKIVRAETLSTALEFLEQGERFDAVLCDLTLPDSRGFETLEKLLARFPDQTVIVQTGLSDKVMGLQAIRAGAQDFLVKGAYDADQLGKTLRYAIERRSVLERLEETQRLAHIGHWEFDVNSGQFMASDEMFRIVGLQPEKRIFSADDLNDPSHVLHFLKKIHHDTLQEGQVFRDLEITTATGGVRFVAVKCRKEINGGSLYGILQDISERKKADELRRQHEISQQAAAMKEQFIASVSHEMRTPMNAILGMSNLVLDSPLNEEQRGYISSIKQSSEILLGIVNDILEISTLKNGSIEFEEKPFDLHELLANLVNVMSYKINEKKLEFNLEIEPNVPRFVAGDKLRLNQILYNLVGNAIKFTDAGFVRVYVSTSAPENNRVQLQFDVEDSGIGIPKDQLDAIFESFTRVRHKNRLFEGTGLGLSIARSLVQQQNGIIGVESELGKGSKFYFSLSLIVASEQEIEKEKLQRTGQLSFEKNKKFRLLLVEDHKMNQLVARKTLEKHFPNIEVIIAENGREAIDVLQLQNFDIILMDLQMPIMDGIETTQYIRQQMHPRIAKLPILAMTAHAHISKDNQFQELGMDDYVLKPFEPEQLFDKIGKWIGKN